MRLNGGFLSGCSSAPGRLLRPDRGALLLLGNLLLDHFLDQLLQLLVVAASAKAARDQFIADEAVAGEWDLDWTEVAAVPFVE